MCLVCRTSDEDCVCNCARVTVIVMMVSEECREDLRRDEEIFGDKVRELKRARKQLKVLQEDNDALTRRLSASATITIETTTTALGGGGGGSGSRSGSKSLSSSSRGGKDKLQDGWLHDAVMLCDGSIVSVNVNHF